MSSLYLQFQLVLIYAILQSTSCNVILVDSGPECMKDIGCFPITPDFIDEVHRPINSQPSPRKYVGTTFHLFTVNNRKRAFILRVGDKKSVYKSTFQGELSTKVIIPGWMDNLDIARWLFQLKDALLDNELCNVIIIEWTNMTPYNTASADSRIVGAELANLIVFLERIGNTSRNRFHLIGHSLGAHIAGYSGLRVPGIARITGLDPARPFFEHMPTTVRLDPSDADFVDVIHTDTIPHFPFGFTHPLGHIDFFPNGPHKQPGCKEDKLRRGIQGLNNGIFHALTESVRFTVSCNHQRAYQFFIESITNKYCKFVAVKCANFDSFLSGKCVCDTPNSCAPMGIGTDIFYFNWIFKPEPETYRWFLTTGETETFCLFQYQIVLIIGNIVKPVTAKLLVTFVDKYNRRLTVVIKSADGLLRPGVEIKQLVASKKRIGETLVSLSVAVLFSSKQKVKQITRLSLEYVRLTPIQLRSEEAVIKVYCHRDTNIISTSYPLTINFLREDHC